MLCKPKTPAPEPYASAALWLLFRVALFIRNEAHSISPAQLSDLGEAIHDIPQSLTEYGHYFDERKIRDEFLAVYDAKWARSAGDFSLVEALDQGVERVQDWSAHA